MLEIEREGRRRKEVCSLCRGRRLEFLIDLEKVRLNQGEQRELRHDMTLKHLFQ
jgi:hypothetical protein